MAGACSLLYLPPIGFTVEFESSGKSGKKCDRLSFSSGLDLSVMPSGSSLPRARDFSVIPGSIVLALDGEARAQELLLPRAVFLRAAVLVAGYAGQLLQLLWLWPSLIKERLSGTAICDNGRPCKGVALAAPLEQCNFWRASCQVRGLHKWSKTHGSVTWHKRAVH